MWQTQDVWTPKASSGCPPWLAPHLLLHAQQVSLPNLYLHAAAGLSILAVHTVDTAIGSKPSALPPDT